MHAHIVCGVLDVCTLCEVADVRMLNSLGSDGRLSSLFDFFASFGNSFTSVACEVRETGRLDSSDI